MTLAETLRRGRRAGSQVAAREPAVEAPAQPFAGAQPEASAAEPEPGLRDWIGVLAMGIGLFMAIMDVQIVTSSLTQIQGGLSASIDEIAWVQTAYLIADVVMVPMCGIMSRLCRHACCLWSPRSVSPGPAHCAPPQPISAR